MDTAAWLTCRSAQAGVDLDVLFYTLLECYYTLHTVTDHDNECTRQFIIDSFRFYFQSLRLGGGRWLAVLHMNRHDGSTIG